MLLGKIWEFLGKIGNDNDALGKIGNYWDLGNCLGRPWEISGVPWEKLGILGSIIWQVKQPFW